MTDDIGEAIQQTATLQEEVSRLQSENASVHERMLRALADSENTRWRSEKSLAEARKYAISDFARDLLSVNDNLERALAGFKINSNDCDALLYDGVVATQRLLQATFERFNIKKIAALGSQFDPAFHEALTHSEDLAHEPGAIVQVFEEGYTINDRLLRPARVIIARGRPPN